MSWVILDEGREKSKEGELLKFTSCNPQLSTTLLTLSATATIGTALKN